MKNISDIRKEYQLHQLNEREVASDPVDQFSIWWENVLAAGIDEANAMTLATVNGEGKPSARIVLLKGFDKKGFVFFTNYESRKGRELSENENACLVFYWKEIERQVRIEGAIEKLTSEESDAYFSSRPRGSQIGAWASPQSSVITDRSVLDEHNLAAEKRFESVEIPRPAHWGGYRVKPDSIEFWQGRSNRLHDRLRYTLEKAGQWRLERLAP